MTDQRRIGLLIVDDHDILRDSLAIFFETCDDISLLGQAESGLDGFRLCGELNPDVVLMDLMMPEVDGVATTRMIREAFPHIQVLVLTNFEQADLVQAAIEAGATGYLIKSVSVDELVEAIRDASQGRFVVSKEIDSMLKTYEDAGE